MAKNSTTITRVETKIAIRRMTVKDTTSTLIKNRTATTRTGTTTAVVTAATTTMTAKDKTSILIKNRAIITRAERTITKMIAKDKTIILKKNKAIITRTEKTMILTKNRTARRRAERTTTTTTRMIAKDETRILIKNRRITTAIETTTTVTRILLVTISRLQAGVTVVGDEATLTEDGAAKNAGGAMMPPRQGGGVMTILTHGSEGDLVAANRLRTIEEGIIHLKEEEDGTMTTTVVVIATGITVIAEELGLKEKEATDQ